MGFISNLMGTASTADLESLSSRYHSLLSPNESLAAGYHVFRDTFLFTNKRLILVDVQGMMGSKIQYLTIPYKSISRFSIETAGALDLDAELLIWVAGSHQPIKKKFTRKTNIYELQRILANYVL